MLLQEIASHVLILISLISHLETNSTCIPVAPDVFFEEQRPKLPKIVRNISPDCHLRQPSTKSRLLFGLADVMLCLLSHTAILALRCSQALQDGIKPIVTWCLWDSHASKVWWSEENSNTKFCSTLLGTQNPLIDKERTDVSLVQDTSEVEATLTRSF